SLTDYAFFRRLVWKPIYEVLARKLNFDDWHFMNYGYMPAESESAVMLASNEEMHRCSIQLYHYLATQIEIKGTDVLEVGSGRGGGARYIKNQLGPKRMVGMDIAKNAIKFSCKTHVIDGLSFVQGNAEKIPFEQETFDVILNVESCHAYGSVPKFLKEVKRVLRNGGYFLCTDIRSPVGMDTLRNQLLNSGLKLIRESVISSNVVKAIEYEEAIKKKRIEDNVPKWFQNMFKEFAGVKGSEIHTGLKSSGLVYHSFVLIKE
ncbi:MAG TPA: class I SAM-dependent methyltransferase, partial [Chitinophagaceae bacterium]|nr:class I SAM-dependent methyltransferase [Chitinophagaceae bacterium]